VGTTSISSWNFATLVANTPAQNTIANYPETGETTTFSVTLYDPTYNVYDIKATTTFPSNDIRQSYVEEYYVQDVGKNSSGYFSDTTPDGVWTTDDPIVQKVASFAQNGGWEQNQDARVQMLLTFQDGTTRSETIVSDSNPSASGVIAGQAATVGGPKFESFDVSPTASLDLSQQFVPAVNSSDPTINYSSVVVYEVHPSTNQNFWFWQGSQAQTIVGVRYYTEQYTNGGSTLNATSVSFEKTISTNQGTGGSYATTLQTLNGSSTFNTLAESVLRESVSWPTLSPNGSPNLSSATINKYMQTRVINITSSVDFYINQANSDYVNLALANGTQYTPTGAVDMAVASDPTTLLFNRTSLTTGVNGALPIVYPTTISGSTFLAQVYTSIVEGSAVVPATTTTPPTNLSGGTVTTSQVQSFNGQQVVGSTTPNVSSFNLGQAGMVEAWVYLNQLTDTMGIVHYGTQPNFSDEGYSLQGWNANGQITMVVDSTGGNYDQVLSKHLLGTGKWYYLVGVWDVTNGNHYISIYINGNLDATTTSLNYINPSGSQAANETSSVMIGSQLPSSYNAQLGYFGLNGKITGVVISNPYNNAGVRPYGPASNQANISSYVKANFQAYNKYTSGW
jgi:hypothetical protein